MSVDSPKSGQPTAFQDQLGRSVYETAMRGAFVPAWPTLHQAKRWRWIWAGEAAVATARATLALPVPEPASVSTPTPPPRPAVTRVAGTEPLSLQENWGAQIRKRPQERSA